MDMKQQFYQALCDNRGQLSEIELGEALGLTEDETQKIISRLLDEYRIEFVSQGSCSYRPKKK
jgi:hypothetical protein